MDDHELLLSIQERLDGVVWSPDTLEDIAKLMVKSGYRIRDKDDVDREPDPGSDNPDCVHEWAYTGTAYGGDDERWMGEGRAYCVNCGADGDA